MNLHDSVRAGFCFVRLYDQVAVPRARRSEGGYALKTVAAEQHDAVTAMKVEARRKVRLVDCDVHAIFRRGLDDLSPYLPKAWQQRLGIGVRPGWARNINGGQIALPQNTFYRTSSSPLRMDAAPPGGGVPSSDPAHVARHLLDAYEIDRAILLGNSNSGNAAFPDYDASAALASAYNDWLCETWLSVDTRFRGAILVAPQDPELAVKEIERVADRPGVAAIHMPLFNIAPGERHFSRIYAAAEHYGLPIMAHPGATEAIYVRAPQLAYVPTYYLEFHTLLTQPAQSGLASLIVHGVFERFPKLRYVFVESGFVWAMDVLWRLERDWKAHRAEVPWVKRHPLDYLVTNVRFTTQPFYEAGKPEQMHAVLDAIHAEHTLLFSSDYPHWDFDNPRRALKDLPGEIRRRVFAENALDTFGDRLS
jgi:predicted TIM-barrel fold metal-dependent hydrolase